MDALSFAYPYWLLAGLFSCGAVVYLLHRLRLKRQETLARFAGAQLLGRLTRNVSATRRRLKDLLLVAAILLLFAALARPQYGFTWVEVKRKGIDILFALDTSNSMLAQDTKPNRLERARLGIMDFVTKLEGDRVGLMPFAGTGYLMCPLTLDYDAFISSLGTVDTTIIPTGGTNISAVISQAETVLTNDANHKILVVVTDGENLEGDAVEAARTAAARGMTIYTVGVGTPGGELIPLAGQGGAGFVKDDAGKYITSKLDEKTLTAIAEATGGLYEPLGDGGEGLETIYRQKLHLIPKEELAERRQKLPTERFGWPLAAALVLLLIEFLLPERRPAGRNGLIPGVSTVRQQWRKLMPALLVALPLASSALPAHASDAEDAYRRGDYLHAAELYREALKKQPDDPKLHYNLGTTAYKNNLYDEAAASFAEALKSDDLLLQQKAYYNRGNALYQKGVESRQANPQATREKWQEALQSYDGAITLDPADVQARENRQFVARQLEELAQQPQQQGDTNDQNQQQEGGKDQQPSDKSGQQQDPPDPDKKDPQAANPKQTGDQPEKANKSQQPKNTEQHNQQPKPDGQQQAGQDQDRPQPQPDEQNRQAATADQDAEQNRDAERRSLGKMTGEEAENLLNALKNEEGELNFVPSGQGQDQSVRRDW